MRFQSWRRWKSARRTARTPAQHGGSMASVRWSTQSLAARSGTSAWLACADARSRRLASSTRITPTSCSFSSYDAKSWAISCTLTVPSWLLCTREDGEIMFRLEHQLMEPANPLVDVGCALATMLPASRLRTKCTRSAVCDKRVAATHVSTLSTKCFAILSGRASMKSLVDISCGFVMLEVLPVPRFPFAMPYDLERSADILILPAWREWNQQ